jgi:drug/metabolite transporter (DMT)-like permease
VLTSSTASIFIRFAQAEAPSLVIAAYRLSLATLILLPILLTRHREDLAGMQRRDLALTLLSGLFLSLHFSTWISSLEFTSVASSVVLVQTAPLFVALLSPWILHEKIGMTVVFGLGLTLIGSLVIGASDLCMFAGGLQCPSFQELVQGPALKGDLLALAGALGASAYLILGRIVRRRTALMPYITLTYGTAALVLCALMLAGGQQPFGYSRSTYTWFILLALIPQLLAHSSYNWVLRYLPAAVVSLTLLGEPIGSTLLAYFLLNEVPTMLRLIGAAGILAGIAIVAIRPSVRKGGTRPN